MVALARAGDAAARDRLVLHYLPFARTLAAVHYRGRIHADAEFDDYLQLARLGLMESVDRYEPERGAQFKTYVAHRIRGALLNGLEKATEKSQQIAARKRLQAERLESVKSAALDAAASHPSDEGRATVRGTAARSRQSTLLAYLAEVGIGIALGVMLEDTGMVAADGESEGRDVAAVAASPTCCTSERPNCNAGGSNCARPWHGCQPRRARSSATTISRKSRSTRLPPCWASRAAGFRSCTARVGQVAPHAGTGAALRRLPLDACPYPPIPPQLQPLWLP